MSDLISGVNHLSQTELAAHVGSDLSAVPAEDLNGDTQTFSLFNGLFGGGPQGINKGHKAQEGEVLLVLQNIDMIRGGQLAICQAECPQTLFAGNGGLCQIRLPLSLAIGELKKRFDGPDHDQVAGVV